eukprot:s180_g24.t1
MPGSLACTMQFVGDGKPVSMLAREDARLIWKFGPIWKLHLQRSEERDYKELPHAICISHAKPTLEVR